MEININRSALLPSLQVVNGVIERRQPLPILVNLLLSVTTEEICLTGSDMEVELISRIKSSNKETGDITLPARKLLDICRALPENAEIKVKINGDKAQVRSGKSRFTLTTLPPVEYPIIDVGEKLAEFSLQQSTLKQILEKTAFSMAQQDVRYYLNGLLLEITGKQIRAVATDGHRLALCDTETSVKTDETHQIIVPRKGVIELIRLLETGKKEVNVIITSNHIRVEFDELTFTSKLIDGKFPDYDRVIPEVEDIFVVADREQLRQSLTRASILSNEKYRGVRISLEKNKLRALAHNPEQEEAEEELEVEYDGQNLEIGFNVSYILDALGIIKTGKVRIAIKDPNSSCLLLPEIDENCKYVVMPMRL
ncbi:MAG: DNA polymerase III subunit beta [Gammaproteobacteria bacterium]|nr:DNA polymerase III subunit beta [Gammaproteobacteria bacterium]